MEDDTKDHGSATLLPGVAPAAPDYAAQILELNDRYQGVCRQNEILIGESRHCREARLRL